MTQGGFYDQKSLSPSGLALVVAMHAAALGALALVKGPEFVRPFFPPTKVIFIPRPEDPPPNPPPPPTVDRPVQRPTVIDIVPPVIERVTPGPIVRDQPIEPLPVADPPGPRIVEARVDLPPSVRIAAEFDPRFAGDMQPPYPPSEERAQRGGTVRVRLTIGADGRVRAVERLSATSDAFWRATERHALTRWRFRPATLDGRPIASSKTMSVYFRIEG